jgi:NAD(P)H-hydrate repair Nnr-like enzyme with NAD(P)H-hydrate dehydratase domain
VPVVADADALSALGDLQGAERLVAASERAVVLTPHDGEYRQLVREDPGSDRVAAACRLARATGAVALVKGPTTAVASPEEDRHPSVLLATAGSPALATAGSGDVLAGVVGAFVARGLDPLAAAGLAAHVHGRAAGLGRPEGLIAPDLPDLVADWLSAVLRRG